MVELLWLVIPWSLGLTDATDPQLARTYFWFTGHPLVYFWLLPAYVSWYGMLPKQAGGKLVDFAGWDMPINYGSQIDEHHTVRKAAGMFDVSHMTVVDLEGERVRAFLRHLLANDVAKLQTPGKALYSCMLQEDGGVIDDGLPTLG